ncbi:hypothetical protein D3C80_1615120 [compost metagenome]
MTDVSGISDQLKENASDLLPSNKNVVWPFQPCIFNTEGLQRAHYRQADHQAQTFKLPHAAFDTQHEAVIQIFSKGADPLPTATPPSSTLTLCQH